MGSGASFQSDNNVGIEQFRSEILAKYGQLCDDDNALKLINAFDNVKVKLLQDIVKGISKKPLLKGTEFRLHLAAKVGNTEDIILSCMDLTDLNCLWRRDDFDNIPLYYACLNGHTLCCAWLLLYMRFNNDLFDSFQTSIEMERFIINSLNNEIKLLLKNKLDCKGN